MTSEEKMREEFEAWHKAVYSYLPRYDIAHDYYLESECDDRYDVWKASRESLVIELPEMIGMNQPFTGTPISEIRAHNHFNDAIKKCRESIHTAGVKTK